MQNSLNFSVYISSFEKQKRILENSKNTGAMVFLSLHIPEEFSSDYKNKVEEVCNWLNTYGFKIIADVSTNTLKEFKVNDIVSLGKHLKLFALRLDFGFSLKEIIEIGKKIPIVLNASTINEAQGKAIANSCPLVMAMHNFYPRPETGLDKDYFLNTTKTLQDSGLKVLAFIPGDYEKRGPLHEGLPTLEYQRNYSPYVSFLEMILDYKVDGVFLGDISISPFDLQLIEDYCTTNVIKVPSTIFIEDKALFNLEFTNRIDSPNTLIRFAESRFYFPLGKNIVPFNNSIRKKGSITIDNNLYKRYCGEIQITKADFEPNTRINVIGEVCHKYLPIIDLIKRNMKFQLIKTTSELVVFPNPRRGNTCLPL